MIRTVRRALPFAALALATSFAAAQDDRRPENYLGASIGTYLLTDGDTRDAFGTAPISYGVSFVQPFRQARRGLRFDVSALSLNANGNNFFLLGGTIGYEIQALRVGDRPTAFARVGVGPAFYSYDVNGATAAQNRNDDTISFLGSAEVGYTFANRFVASARYFLTPELDGLNFSGLQFQLTYAAFKL